MLSLTCEVKQYKWGQPGAVSLVADLASCNSGSAINAAEPYAELWMGAHESGPSKVRGNGMPLHKWLARSPLALGAEVLANYGNSLPFLFKVLSISKALSIQSHPDKVLARQLHAARPEAYPDDNHKPELALAVRDFEALCGFCTLGEIRDQLNTKPELRRCVGDHHASALCSAARQDAGAQRDALQQAFTALMTSEPATYNACSRELYERLTDAGPQGRCQKDSLFVRIYEQFPGDVGTLAVFFLNYVQLHPGEAIYLAANEPHAYLSGELIEAMASSDNVIRAGLTPKLRDTDVLCHSLTYKQGAPHMLKGEPISRGISLYQPPFEEFQVLRVDVEQPGTISLPAQKSPMMLLGLESTGTHSLQCLACFVKDPSLESLVQVSRGTVLFIPAGTSLQLHSLEAEDGAGCRLLAYAATANDNMFVSAKEAARLMYRSISDLSFQATAAKAKLGERVREEVYMAGSMF